MTKLQYAVTYYDYNDHPVSSGTIEAEDYWDACTRTLRNLPPGVEDFDITGPGDPEDLYGPRSADRRDTVAPV